MDMMRLRPRRYYQIQYGRAAEVFRGASMGVSKYELSVTVASFGKYTTLVEEPNFFTEPTYVLFVQVTYENTQSAGLSVGRYLKVKTGVLQWATGNPTNDALVRDRIDALLLDVTPDMVHVRLLHRL